MESFLTNFTSFSEVLVPHMIFQCKNTRKNCTTTMTRICNFTCCEPLNRFYILTPFHNHCNWLSFPFCFLYVRSKTYNSIIDRTILLPEIKTKQNCEPYAADMGENLHSLSSKTFVRLAPNFPLNTRLEDPNLQLDIF